MSGPGIIQRSVGSSFIPQASAAPRNAGAPFEALSGAAGEGLKLIDKMQEANDQHAVNQSGLALQKQLDDYKIAYAKDPDPATAAPRFETEAQKAVNAAIEGLPQNKKLRDTFADQWGLHIESARADVQLDAVKRIADNTNASTIEVLDDTAKRSAYANPAERKLYAKQASDALLGAVNAGAMTAKTAQAKASKWHSDIAEFDARQAILVDPRSGLSLLKDPNNFAALDPVKRLELQEKADTAIRQDEREARVARTYEKAELRADIADAKTQLDAGLPVDPVPLADMGKKVAATGDPGLANRFDTVRAQVVTQDKLRGATPVDVDQVIDNLTTEGATHPSATIAAALSSARTFRNRMQEGLKSDPLNWAASQGVVKLQPLQLNGTDNAAAWHARVVEAETAARTYGRTPVYFTNAEENALHNQLKSADPQGKLALATQLEQGLGPDRAPLAFARLAPKDPVWGQAAVLASRGKKAAALDALTGQAMLTAKGAKPSEMAPDKVSRGDQFPQLDEAFRANHTLGAHVSATAQAIYVARAHGRGLSGQDAQAGDGKELWSRAVQEAAGAEFVNGEQYGGFTPYNGRNVAIPASIKAGDFESVVKGLDAASLAAASLKGGPPVTSDGKPYSDLRSAYLIAVGDGRYVISTTDPHEEPHLLQDAKAHGPYVLDLARALPWMRGAK